jgi:hypothetical protein
MTYYILSILTAFGLLAAELTAQNDLLYTVSTAKARPVAMGGAFTAVADDIAAIDYNPAAFFLYQEKPVNRFTFFVNPPGIAAGTLQFNDIFQGDGAAIDDFLLAAGLVMKSVCVTFGSLDVGLLLGEQALTVPDTFRTDKITRTAGLRQNHSHSLAASLKLAKRVSLGATVSYLVQSTNSDAFDTVKGFAIDYGIMLQPESNLRIGVFYTSLPDTVFRYRWNIESLVDESVNVGASYTLFGNTLVALDLRNLGEEGNFAVREFHAGFEQVLLSHVALRAGFFRNDDGNNTYSFGIGLFDGNSLHRTEKRFDHRNILLNYAFVYESAPKVSTRTHLLTFVLRI